MERKTSKLLVTKINYNFFVGILAKVFLTFENKTKVTENWRDGKLAFSETEVIISKNAKK